jgi:hypothetical protein
MAVTKKTWSTYKTAETMLMKCQKETGINMHLPLDTPQTLTFIDWLATARSLKLTTINSYLAGIRQLHITRGLDCPELRTDLVKLVLKGISNTDGIKTRKSHWSGRLPMTINTMLLFHKLITRSQLSEHDKLLIWSVSTLAFAGAFRIHEILARNESTFDPDFTLLTEDVSCTVVAGKRNLHVKLKCPKENRSATPTIVDIYENSGPLCPVSAFHSWVKLYSRERNLPLFRLENGTPLTGARLNKVMKELLGPYTNTDRGYFATHSFRIGLATMLGQSGFEDQEIMASGRWSSRVFERYIKLARTNRNLVSKKVSELNKVKGKPRRQGRQPLA